MPSGTMPRKQFDYFTEVEDTFVRHRGKHLLLSPPDWTLIENWKARGIPLSLVLRSIETVFDRHRRSLQRRAINSLSYCRSEVEARFAEWQQNMVGSAARSEVPEQEPVPEEAKMPFTRAHVLEHLRKSHTSLLEAESRRAVIQGDALSSVLSTVVVRLYQIQGEISSGATLDTERLEAILSDLDAQLDEAALASVTQNNLELRRKGVESQLSSYRERVGRKAFEQMAGRLLLKCLREDLGLPLLTLFSL